MDIVRIKLVKPNSFWFLNDLHLGPGNLLSQPFDLDAADDRTKEKILKAENDFKLIKIIRQPKDTVPTFDINKDGSTRFELPESKTAVEQTATPVSKISPMLSRPVSAEMPELKSFTVEPEPESVESDLVEEITLSDEDMENAKALLLRNGNTIKKVLRSLNKPAQEAKRFLLACLTAEKSDKNRPGIIDAISEALAGVNNDL